MLKPRLVPAVPTLRVLLRRSKDEGQEFSLDVQRDGCIAFAESLRRRTPPASWQERRDYVDDGIAGDDFLGRAGLRRLLDELQAGDVVVCRDHSRLGRDALEVTLAVREIVRNRNARLFYYSSGQEVAFTNAIDAATTFIQGVGAQMELEAIRSRTREALRARVRQGRIAGGRCFGYTNVRKTDGSGRAFTVAVINEAEAEVIRGIFERFLGGAGLKRIAADLNWRAVPSPSAGRRGTGTWATGAVREILRRERYHGVYVHGEIDRIKQGGKRISRPAPAEQVIRVEVPEWRIVDETTWLATQAALPERAATWPQSSGPRHAYPLTGLARCGLCGGSITVGRTKRGDLTVPAYLCSFYSKRGKAVCPATVYQPVDEVDEALARYLQAAVLTPERAERFLADARAEIEAEEGRPLADDVARLEGEIDKLGAEQRRYAAAVASAPDIPELVTELRRRGDRLRALQADLAALRERPTLRSRLLESLGPAAQARLVNLREALARSPEDARAVYECLFPGGLTFTPVDMPPDLVLPHRRGRPTRRVWQIEGAAEPLRIISPTSATPAGFECGQGRIPRDSTTTDMPTFRGVTPLALHSSAPTRTRTVPTVTSALAAVAFPVGEQAPDPVADELAAALDGWTTARDSKRLRRRLAALLGSLK